MVGKQVNKQQHSGQTGGANAATVAKSLRGVSFPNDKKGLVEHAQRQQGGGDGVIETLNRIPEGRYQDMADAEKAVGQIR